MKTFVLPSSQRFWLLTYLRCQPMKLASLENSTLQKLLKLDGDITDYLQIKNTTWCLTGERYENPNSAFALSLALCFLRPEKCLESNQIINLTWIFSSIIPSRGNGNLLHHINDFKGAKWCNLTAKKSTNNQNWLHPVIRKIRKSYAL